MAPSLFATNLSATCGSSDNQLDVTEYQPSVYCAVLVFFLLIFYALALWDRWLKLKMTEQNRLPVLPAPKSYGGVRERRLTTLTQTRGARNDKNLSISDSAFLRVPEVTHVTYTSA